MLKYNPIITMISYLLNSKDTKHLREAYSITETALLILNDFLKYIYCSEIYRFSYS